MRTKIILWGIRRSGNHVIHNWLIRQLIKPRHFILNVKWHDLERVEAKKRTRIANYGTLLVGFESFPLETIPKVIAHNNFDKSLGKYDKVQHVIILRDPWNLFASRLKHGVRRLRHPADYLWVEYAKAFIERPYDALYVSYNQFITDVEYRKELSKALEGEFNDSSIDEVLKYGDGSSFDGQTYNKRGRQMDVFGRWKVYWNDPKYRELFTPEVVELADRLFEGANPDKESKGKVNE